MAGAGAEAGVRAGARVRVRVKVKVRADGLPVGLLLARDFCHDVINPMEKVGQNLHHHAMLPGLHHGMDQYIHHHTVAD